MKENFNIMKKIKRYQYYPFNDTIKEPREVLDMLEGLIKIMVFSKICDRMDKKNKQPKRTVKDVSVLEWILYVVVIVVALIIS